MNKNKLNEQQQKLITDNIKVCKYFFNKIHAASKGRTFINKQDEEEIIHDSLVGAALKFDPSRKYKFHTFLYYYVKYYYCESVRKNRTGGITYTPEKKRDIFYNHSFDKELNNDRTSDIFFIKDVLSIDNKLRKSPEEKYSNEDRNVFWKKIENMLTPEQWLFVKNKFLLGMTNVQIVKDMGQNKNYTTSVNIIRHAMTKLRIIAKARKANNIKEFEDLLLG